MQAIGFRRTRGVFLLNVAPGVLGFVGFNSGRAGYDEDSAALHPVVGVRFEAVERALEEVLGFSSEAPSPTVVEHLQSIVSPGQPLELIVSLDDSGSYDRAVRLIAEHGVPFIKNHSGIDTAIAAAQAGLGTQLQFRIPIMELIAGRRDIALQLLRELRSHQSPEGGPWAEYVASNSLKLIRSIESGDLPLT